MQGRPAESPSTIKISDSALSVLVQSASLPGSVDLVSTLFLRTSSRAFLAASAARHADTALPRIWFSVAVSISKVSEMPCSMSKAKIHEDMIQHIDRGMAAPVLVKLSRVTSLEPQAVSLISMQVKIKWEWMWDEAPLRRMHQQSSVLQGCLGEFLSGPRTQALAPAHKFSLVQQQSLHVKPTTKVCRHCSVQEVDHHTPVPMSLRTLTEMTQLRPSRM